MKSTYLTLGGRGVAGRLCRCWLLISVLALAAAAAGAAEIVDRIVAVVNNDIITQMELEREMQPYTERIAQMGYSPADERRMREKVRTDMLDQLIDKKLTDQEIARQKISIADSEVDEAIERVKRMNLYTDEELRAAIAREGGNLEDYRQKLKEQLLRTKLVNYAVKSKIIITRQDVQAYYDSHLEAYAGQSKYHLRNIVVRVPPPGDAAAQKAAWERMQEVLRGLESGRSFAALAAEYSDSSLAEKGGDLGRFALSDMAEQIRTALEGLKPGEVTPILETDQGLQLFFVEDFIPARTKPLDEVAAEIESKLYNEIVDRKFVSWLQELRNGSHIEIIP